MGKSIRSKAHKHKRSKRREKSESHYDELAEKRAEIARKHLEEAQPVRDDEDKVARQAAARAEKDAEAKRSKKDSGKMQWEAMKPTRPSSATDADAAGAMDLDDAIRTTRSSARFRNTTRSRRDFQGGKLVGVFKKTNKKVRKKQKNRLKRSGEKK